MTWALARIAIDAATTAPAAAPARAAQMGTKSYRRVPATRARFQTPIPTATSTGPSTRSPPRISRSPSPVITSPATMPMTTRISGPIQPRLMARLKKKRAPISSVNPPAQASPRPLTARSRSASETEGKRRAGAGAVGAEGFAAAGWSNPRHSGSPSDSRRAAVRRASGPLATIDGAGCGAGVGGAGRGVVGATVGDAVIRRRSSITRNRWS